MKVLISQQIEGFHIVFFVSLLGYIILKHFLQYHNKITPMGVVSHLQKHFVRYATVVQKYNKKRTSILDQVGRLRYIC